METISDIRIAMRLRDVAWKTCGSWTIMNGMVEKIMILAAYAVQISVLTPDPAKNKGYHLIEQIIKNKT